MSITASFTDLKQRLSGRDAEAAAQLVTQYSALKDFMTRHNWCLSFVIRHLQMTNDQ